MPLYRYVGIGKEGEKIYGSIDGETLESAKEKLLKQTIYLLQIGEEKISFNRSFFKGDEQLQFTKELSRLLKAGLPLFEALQAMEEKYRGQKIQPLLIDLGEQVKSGALLSAALKRHAKSFDLLYVGMIANSEKSGRLSDALDELAELLAKKQAVKKKLIATFLYPAILLFFCALVLIMLLFHVVPSIRDLFEGRELHPMTRFVFAWSAWAIKTKLIWIGAFLSCASGMILLHATKRGKDIKDRLVSKLPWIKTLLAKLALIRFFRASSTLIQGGLPLLAAVEQARYVMGHKVLEEALIRSERAILEGKKVQSAMVHPLIPPLVPRLLGIGEEGGDLAAMMKQIAEIFEEELEQLLAHFSTLAQPILLIFLGLVVGFILLSILLPLTDTGSMAGF